MKKILRCFIEMALISGLVSGCAVDKVTKVENERTPSQEPIVQVGVSDDKSSPNTAETIFSELEINQISRTLGHFLTRQLMVNEDCSFNMEEVVAGIKAEMNNEVPPLTEEEYQEKLAHLQKVTFDKRASVNLSLADSFLKDNAKQEDVVEVEANRLQYQILEQGTGPVIADDATPLIHYKGSFIGGEVFSSSYDLQDPILLPLAQAIPGFSLGMKGMKEGEKRILYIHPDLAYGCSGHLPPNSLLIFEISLVKADGISNEKVVEEIS